MPVSGEHHQIHGVIAREFGDFVFRIPYRGEPLRVAISKPSIASLSKCSWRAFCSAVGSVPVVGGISPGGETQAGGTTLSTVTLA